MPKTAPPPHVHVILTDAESRTKLGTLKPLAQSAANTVHGLSGEYPWNLVPRCPDTIWAVNTSEEFRALINKWHDSHGTTDLLQEIVTFSVEEAQNHRKKDRTKLSFEDVKITKLHFFPEMREGGKRTTRSATAKRGAQDATTVSSRGSPAKKRSRRHHDSQNDDELTFDGNIDPNLQPDDPFPLPSTNGTDQTGPSPSQASLDGLAVDASAEPNIWPTNEPDDNNTTSRQEVHQDGIELDKETADNKPADGGSRRTDDNIEPIPTCPESNPGPSSRPESQQNCPSSPFSSGAVTEEGARDVSEPFNKQLNEVSTWLVHRQQKLRELYNRYKTVATHLEHMKEAVNTATIAKKSSEAAVNESLLPFSVPPGRPLFITLYPWNHLRQTRKD
ncbi:hypothetical protein MRS44_006841 [Fusarium solani]|uniref:Uncharacterized protein n=1 Tax=Fusarium solani TaxID=169388 RepID=A0A9P9RCU9_FUSSL|nr:uncharacterized protein B0J15DRAFT_457120 [Fusarium solani]KAH7274911.1 hypothetical protein B0J15DRAFT_457120 [Fusarium solani]KAJ3466183.1 hypothetical protein MRS44_006841 [Fusarium solani]